MTEAEFFNWFSEYMARATGDNGRRIVELIRRGDHLAEVMFPHPNAPLVPAPISPVASYIDGLLVALDGWELEDLTLPALEALASTARTWHQAWDHAYGGPNWKPPARTYARAYGGDPNGLVERPYPPDPTPKTVQPARSAWVHRIRVQLGLAPAATPATDPGPTP